MAFAVISGTKFQTAATATSPAIDTTGASTLIVVLSERTPSSGVISDSKGNTWSQLTVYSDDPNDHACSIWWSNATSVGTNHTFTATGTDMACTVSIAAFSGGATSPFDLQNGNNAGTGSTVQPGSITPTQDSELVIAGFVHDRAALPTIGGGFTMYQQLGFGAQYGGGLAYLIQTTATAANPTITFDGTTTSVAVIASFKIPPAPISPDKLAWRPEFPDILLDTSIESVASGFIPRSPSNPSDPTPT